MAQERTKTLGLGDMVGMALAGFVSMELIGSLAGLGPAIIVTFIIVGGVYILSHSLICAELGSTYPDQGGIYVWVKKALGDKWAARTNWWYWLNVVGFVPSIMIPLVSVFKQLVWPDMPFMALLGLSIAGTWLICILTMFPLKNTKVLNNVGTAAKVLFCVVLVGAAISVAAQGESQVVYTLENMAPEVNLSLVALIPVIAYGLTGMDLIGTAAGEMRDPGKDMPKAMIISAVIAFALYLGSIIAMQIILPVTDISSTDGLIDSMIVVFGSSKVVLWAVAITLALTYFSNAFAWPLAANRAAQEAAEAGEFPKVFAKTNKYGSPVGGAVVLGIASTALLVLYGLIANSNEDLFWTILAFTGVIFLLPYVVLSVSYLKLRKDDPDAYRPFSVPGKVFPTIVGVVSLVMLIGSCVFFVLPPEGEGAMYLVIMVGTLVVSQVIGEIIIKRSVVLSEKAN